AIGKRWWFIRQRLELTDTDSRLRLRLALLEPVHQAEGQRVLQAVVLVEVGGHTEHRLQVVSPSLRAHVGVEILPAHLLQGELTGLLQLAALAEILRERRALLETPRQCGPISHLRFLPSPAAQQGCGSAPRACRRTPRPWPARHRPG